MCFDLRIELCNGHYCFAPNKGDATRRLLSANTVFTPQQKAKHITNEVNFTIQLFNYSVIQKNAIFAKIKYTNTNIQTCRQVLLNQRERLLRTCFGV